MRKFVFILTFLFATLSLTAYAAQPSNTQPSNTQPSNTQPSNTPPKKPITEEMIKKRNATVTYMDANYKNAMDNLEKIYKAVLEAKKDPKKSGSVDSKLSSAKITKVYTYYKDKINMAYENDKKYILIYYGE